MARPCCVRAGGPRHWPACASPAAAGSAADAADRRRRPASSGRPSSTGTLTVFAAASLTDVFTELGDQLMADHPGLDVQFNFAGSSALATQITQGAPADVFASADEVQMAKVTDADLRRGPRGLRRRTR